MPRKLKVIILIGIIFVLVGFAGRVYGLNNFLYGGKNTYNSENSLYTFPHGRMMYRFNDVETGEKVELEDLIDKVNDYLDNYNEHLEIGDIFIYEDSDYYFSIEEKETGLGAMELLVNPYTGAIYPEYGPNMMWNQKYGMLNNMWRHGMMGRRGMGSSYFYNEDPTDLKNTLSFDEARNKASSFIAVEFGNQYTVSNSGHEFYGYFTFHVDKNQETVGMLSVNGFTGEVWYHDWHGTLIEVVGMHK